MEHLGYHKNCNGHVRFRKLKRKKKDSPTLVAHCSKCNYDIWINDGDILNEPEDKHFKIQKKCGIKKRIKKYDYSTWNDVK